LAFLILPFLNILIFLFPGVPAKNYPFIIQASVCETQIIQGFHAEKWRVQAILKTGILALAAFLHTFKLNNPRFQYAFLECTSPALHVPSVARSNHLTF